METSAGVRRPSEAGEVAELDQGHIVTLLECPVCSEIPFPPITGCQKGHIVCNNCQPKVKKCPICLSGFSLARSYFMESIVMSTKFFCAFKDQGCQLILRGEIFKSHTENCNFKPARIPETNANANEPQILGGCQWIPCSINCEILQLAVPGGTQYGTPLYVGRAWNSGGLFPGKLNGQTKELSFPWEGRERIKQEYEILVAQTGTLAWIPSVGGVLPNHSLIGGKTDIGEALYVGRCDHFLTKLIGWVLPSRGVLTVSLNDEEFRYTQFEVLVKTELGLALERQNL